MTFDVAAGPYKGRELKRFYVFSDKAWFFFHGLCQATGRFTDDELAAGDGDGGFDAEALDEKLLSATVVLAIEQKEDARSDRADGLRNEIGRAYALDSPRGRQAAAAANYDPRMP